MKKIYLITALGAASLVLTYCSASKKASKKAPPTTYAADVSTVIATNCTPCHIPSKGGNKKPYDVYANAKSDIDEMIRRIELNPTDKGFMPFKKTEKLSPEIVAVFKKWKEDGLMETK